MKIRQKKNDPYNIGMNIRKFRMDRKLTQEATVAQMQLLGIQISRGTYSQIECGLSNIKVEKLLALAEIFHIEIGDFFQGLSLHQ